MKGQYRIINEIFLFLLGIFIVSVVAFSLGGVEERIGNISTEDNLRSVSDLIITGVIKVYEAGENSSIVLKMPPYVLDKTYRINMIGDSLVVSLHDDVRVNVTQEIFNISLSKDIFGELTTSSEYIVITHNESAIEIKKFVDW